MKKSTILISFLAVLIMGCNKTRTCNCTITDFGVVTTNSKTAGFPPVIPAGETVSLEPYNNSSTRKSDYKGVSKRRVRQECAAKTQESINSTNVNTSPGIYTITATNIGTRTTDCRIQ